MSQTQNPVVTLQASVSKTSTFNGTGVDISGYVGQPVITLKVTSLTAGKTATFAIQDSADNFSSDIRTLDVFTLNSVADSRTPRTRDFHTWEMPGIRYGVTSSKVRLALITLDSGGTVVYEAYIQAQD